MTSRPGNRAGRNLHFGIREHAAAAITNGMALTKLRPYWSGFLIFSDYARGAIRLSALMEIPVLHIFTHDSIGVGEDGPTHQPVEQLVSLRAIPGLLVFRPADANEVVETWRIVTAVRHEPAALILSRQALPTLDRSTFAPATGVARGAYVLAEADTETPDVILLATGSEVHLALAAREELQAGGVGTRVVSMPCWELFDRQPRQYRDEVLPPSVTARVAVEQASTLGWDRYVGDGGAVIGMHTFGASAPLKTVGQQVRLHPGPGRATRARLRDREPPAITPTNAPPRNAAQERKFVNATETLHERGQSLWLDNITRSMLDDGTIGKYIDSYSVTGLTSNPAIFDKAIGSGDYDDAIRATAGRGLRPRSCSSIWPSKTCAAPPTCSCRSTNGPTESMGGSPWRSPPCSLTTPRAPWRRPRPCTRAPGGPTCSSRSPAPRGPAGDQGEPSRPVSR